MASDMRSSERYHRVVSNRSPSSFLSSVNGVTAPRQILQQSFMSDNNTSSAMKLTTVYDVVKGADMMTFDNDDMQSIFTATKSDVPIVTVMAPLFTEPATEYTKAVAEFITAAEPPELTIFGEEGLWPEEPEGVGDALHNIYKLWTAKVVNQLTTDIIAPTVVSAVKTNMLPLMTTGLNEAISETVKTELLPAMDAELQSKLAATIDGAALLIDVDGQSFAASISGENGPSESEVTFERVLAELTDKAGELSDLQGHMKKLRIAQKTLLDKEVKGWMDECETSNINTDESDDQKKAAVLKDRIKHIADIVKQTMEGIRGILVQYYSIPGKVANEKPFSQATFSLPKGIGGAPDPEVAGMLIAVVRKFIHQYPDQVWALIPYVERMFDDATTETPYCPPYLSDDYRDIPESMRSPFAVQNKIFYELLLQTDQHAVQKTLSTFSTGDNSTNMRVSCATEFDGLSVLEHMLHQHEQTGSKARMEMRNKFNVIYALFLTGDPCKVIEKQVRPLIKRARYLRLKVDYESTILPIAQAMPKRDMSFHTPMEKWAQTPPDDIKYNCLEQLDIFVSEIDRTTRNLGTYPKPPKSLDDQHSRAAQQHAAVYFVAHSHKPPPTSAPLGNTPKWSCAGKDCDHIIPDKVREVMMQKIKAKKPGQSIPSTLCSECLTTLKSKGSIMQQNGRVRKWGEGRPQYDRQKGKNAYKTDVKEAESKRDQNGHVPAAEQDKVAAKLEEESVTSITSITVNIDDLQAMIDADKSPAPSPAPSSAATPSQSVLVKFLMDMDAKAKAGK